MSSKIVRINELEFNLKKLCRFYDYDGDGILNSIKHEFGIVENTN